MDDNTCYNCGYFSPSKFIPSMSEGAEGILPDGCPNCGAPSRPYMNQPSPVANDFLLRDAPIPGNAGEPNMEDTGGNPSAEGILAYIRQAGLEDTAQCAFCGAALDELDNPTNHIIEHIIPQSGSMDELGGDSQEIGGNPLLEGQLGEGWKPGTSAEGGRDEYASLKPRWASRMVRAASLKDVGNIPTSIPNPPTPNPKENQIEKQAAPLITDPPVEPFQPNQTITFPYDTGQVNAADFEVTQVINPGPHTVEIDQEGESPLILQHENPKVLDQAKDQLKAAGLLTSLLPGAAEALAPEAAIPASLMGGLTQGATSEGSGIASNPLGSPSGFGSTMVDNEAPAHQMSQLASLEQELHQPDQNSIPIDSEIGQAFKEVLPKLLEFFHSDNSGQDDPDVAGFVSLLQDKAPHILSLSPNDDDMNELSNMIPSEQLTALVASRKESIFPSNVPEEEMTYGDPNKFQEIPLQDYFNDPVAGPIIEKVDGLLATNPNISPDDAIRQISSETGYPFEEIKQVYDTSMINDLHQFAPNMQDYRHSVPDIYEPYMTPDYPQMPPIQSNTWTENDDGSFNSPLTIEKRVETEPQNVDPHEFDFDDIDHWQRGFLTGEGEGGGSQSAFPQDSEVGLNNMNDIPARTELHDQPAPNNPDIVRQLAIMRHRNRATQSSYPIETPAPTNTVFPSVSPDQNPEIQYVCKNCGQKFDGSFVCPYCNQSMMTGWDSQEPANPTQAMQEQQTNQIIQEGIQRRNQAKIASQGPQNAEQFAMIYQYLLENGREDEAGELLMHPEQYAQELANIQHKGTLPAIPEEIASPMPAPMPPQGTEPQEPPQASPAGQPIDHIAADSVAPRCKNCGSSTTRVTSNDGDYYCHACKKTCHSDPLFKDDIMSTSSKQSGINDYPWQTNAQLPLEEGKSYEMFSKQHSIPNVVTIAQVTPNQLTYEIPGGYGLAHKQSVTPEQAQANGLSFIPFNKSLLPNMLPSSPPEPSHEDNNTPFEGWPYQDNMSIQSRVAAPAPTMLYDQTDIPPGQTVQDFNQNSPGNPAVCRDCHRPMIVRGNEPSICANCKYNAEFGSQPAYTKMAGAIYTPSQERELVNEPGRARNLQDLSLDGTHYIEDDAFLFS